jgi:hypothetical protein
VPTCAMTPASSGFWPVLDANLDAWSSPRTAAPPCCRPSSDR